MEIEAINKDSALKMEEEVEVETEVIEEDDLPVDPDPLIVLVQDLDQDQDHHPEEIMTDIAPAQDQTQVTWEEITEERTQKMENKKF